MVSIFDVIKGDLRTLSLQTELLEACDWCDNTLDSVCATAMRVLESVRLPDIPCPFDFYVEKTLRPALIEEIIDENRVDIIIKFIQHDAKFVTWMLNAEEQ